MRPIEHRLRMRQILSFAGMEWLCPNGKSRMSPTDMDYLSVFREYESPCLFSMGELKYCEQPIDTRSSTGIPYGQEWAIEELVVHLARQGARVLVFVAVHDVADPEEDVIVADARVSHYAILEKRDAVRLRTDVKPAGLWVEPTKNVTVRELEGYAVNKWAPSYSRPVQP